MHDIVNNLTLINKELIAINSNTKIIAVSKTFSIDHIRPAIEHGHIHFGENKVQEAAEKWTKVKEKNSSLKLHLIGKLQTNKVKFCLPLFDFIHSLDSIKLADKIANEQIKKNFKPKIFIQVNIGNEEQKSGVNKSSVPDLYSYCKALKLDVVGLMCIPPLEKSSDFFFKEMNTLNKNLDLDELSMGMSSDYLNAIKNSATYVRIGSKIFGERS
mgnify:CR=1 FL=1